MFIFALLQELFQDVYLFLKSWLYYNSKKIATLYNSNVLTIEKKFSIKGNIKNFFKPLYNIPSIVTYFYAIPFRILIIFFALCLHVLNLLFILFLYLLNFLIPLLVIWFFYRLLIKIL